MAQPPRTGIPPAPPPDPNAGRNIHGQPNYQQPQQGNPNAPQPGQVTMHGQPPAPNMAPPEEAPEGLGDNTRAEMEAGRRNLSQYRRRDDAEHEAGRAALAQRAGNRPQE